MFQRGYGANRLNNQTQRLARPRRNAMSSARPRGSPQISMAARLAA
jgi:hypothetical protein